MMDLYITGLVVGVGLGMIIKYSSLSLVTRLICPAWLYI
mgnify:CR=1 FL=1